MRTHAVFHVILNQQRAAHGTHVHPFLLSFFRAQSLQLHRHIAALLVQLLCLVNQSLIAAPFNLGRQLFHAGFQQHNLLVAIFTLNGQRTFLVINLLLLVATDTQPFATAAHFPVQFAQNFANLVEECSLVLAVQLHHVAGTHLILCVLCLVRTAFFRCYESRVKFSLGSLIVQLRARTKITARVRK